MPGKRSKGNFTRHRKRSKGRRRKSPKRGKTKVVTEIPIPLEGEQLVKATEEDRLKYWKQREKDFVTRTGKPSNLYTNEFNRNMAIHDSQKPHIQQETRTRLYDEDREKYHRDLEPHFERMERPDMTSVYTPQTKAIREGTAHYGFQYDEDNADPILAQFDTGKKEDCKGLFGWCNKDKQSRDYCHQPELKKKYLDPCYTEKRIDQEINGIISQNYDDIVRQYKQILEMPIYDYLFGYLSYSSKEIPQERKEGYIYQQLPTKVQNLEIDESDKHSFTYAENVDVPFEIVVQISDGRAGFRDMVLREVNGDFFRPSPLTNEGREQLVRIIMKEYTPLEEFEKVITKPTDGSEDISVCARKVIDEHYNTMMYTIDQDHLPDNIKDVLRSRLNHINKFKQGSLIWAITTMKDINLLARPARPEMYSSGYPRGHRDNWANEINHNDPSLESEKSPEQILKNKLFNSLFISDNKSGDILRGNQFSGGDFIPRVSSIIQWFKDPNTSGKEKLESMKNDFLKNMDVQRLFSRSTGLEAFEEFLKLLNLGNETTTRINTQLEDMVTTFINQDLVKNNDLSNSLLTNTRIKDLINVYHNNGQSGGGGLRDKKKTKNKRRRGRGRGRGRGRSNPVSSHESSIEDLSTLVAQTLNMTPVITKEPTREEIRAKTLGAVERRIEDRMNSIPGYYGHSKEFGSISSLSGMPKEVEDQIIQNIVNGRSPQEINYKDCIDLWNAMEGAFPTHLLEKKSPLYQAYKNACLEMQSTYKKMDKLKEYPQVNRVSFGETNILNDLDTEVTIDPITREIIIDTLLEVIGIDGILQNTPNQLTLYLENKNYKDCDYSHSLQCNPSGLVHRHYPASLNDVVNVLVYSNSRRKIFNGSIMVDVVLEGKVTHRNILKDFFDKLGEKIKTSSINGNYDHVFEGLSTSGGFSIKEIENIKKIIIDIFENIQRTNLT